MCDTADLMAAYEAIDTNVLLTEFEEKRQIYWLKLMMRHRGQVKSQMSFMPGPVGQYGNILYESGGL
ncbi:MAG TPA: hypothetical protein DCK76_01625 [Desulfotomaculum sp.]|nr:hypothetical protein [Desulfotomaculum sp.]HBY04439.1 hypothetical protein [Desulfotomaculum sp.]